MSDPVTDVEIEDVLSSIRRLVGDEHRVKSRPKPVEAVPKPTRLVLTPSLLVPVPDQPEPDRPDDSGDSGDSPLTPEPAGQPEPSPEAADNADADQPESGGDADIDHDTDTDTWSVQDSEAAPQDQTNNAEPLTDQDADSWPDPTAAHSESAQPDGDDFMQTGKGEHAGEHTGEHTGELSGQDVFDMDEPPADQDLDEESNAPRDDAPIADWHDPAGPDQPEPPDGGDVAGDHDDGQPDHADTDSQADTLTIPDDTGDDADQPQLVVSPESDPDSGPDSDPDSGPDSGPKDNPQANSEDDDPESASDTDPEDDIPYSTATLSAKIAALESKIGQTQDQWEPDGELGDDYAGTRVETIEWMDHDTDSTDRTDGTNNAGDTARPGPETRAFQAEFASKRIHPEPPADTPAEAPDPQAEEPVDFMGPDDTILDEESLRELVSDIVRQELQGALGERITRNVRKLVRREIHRALTAQELD